ncbi:MAG TPA: hypothetical protein PK598_05755, partial [Thermoanaerobaculia bacterium]|nr:hypothetical protein [Thermoanaerobaculia bacterium]
ERATSRPLAAGLLRAVVLDAAEPRGSSGLRVRRTARTFVIETRSITEGPLAARLALERAGLEVVLGRRVVVSPAVSLPRGARPARTRA